MVIVQLVIVLCKATTLQQRFRSEPLRDRALDVAALVCVILVLAMVAALPCGCSSQPDSKSAVPGDQPSFEKRSPEESITLLQFLSVSWVSKLLKVAGKRELVDGDVWSLPYTFQHQPLHEAFRRLKGSVIHRLLQANGLDCLVTSTIGVSRLLLSMSHLRTSRTRPWLTMS